MKTTVENLEGFQKKITVSLDTEEVNDRINKQYKDFAYRYNFPGFRKGKAPRPVVDNMLGKNAVRATVTEDVLNSLYPLAMDEHGLIPIGRPNFEESEEMVETGKPFSFSYTVETRPEFELSNYKPLSIKLPSTEATDKEVDDQVEELRNYYYDFEDAPANAKIAEGGFAELAMKVSNEKGELIESLSTDSRLYELGIGLFPKELDEALVGMKKGDSKTVEVSASSPSMMTQNLADAETLTFEVVVKQVRKRIIPELTDEWVKQNAGFESIAELRERMAEQIKAQKQSLLPRLRENEALYELQKRLEGEVPEVMLETQEQDLLQNFFYQLQQSGMSFDMFLAQNGMNPETFKDDLKKQAEDVCKQDLALDAWARHEKIEVTDAEIADEFAKSGAENPAELEEEWRKNGRISALRQSIARTKAIEAILETLDVTELAPGEKLVHEENEEAEKKPAKKGSKAKAAENKFSKDSQSAEKPAAKKAPAKKAPAKKPGVKKESSNKEKDTEEK